MGIDGEYVGLFRLAGNLTLWQSPFNEVDDLILSQLAYVNFDHVVPPEGIEGEVTIRDAAERYFHLYSEERIQNFGDMLRESVYLLRKLANCARFAEAKLSNYQNLIEFEQTKQFSALDITLPDETVYVAYRGTDTSIIG